MFLWDQRDSSIGPLLIKCSCTVFVLPQFFYLSYFSLYSRAEEVILPNKKLCCVERSQIRAPTSSTRYQTATNLLAILVRLFHQVRTSCTKYVNCCTRFRDCWTWNWLRNCVGVAPLATWRQADGGSCKPAQVLVVDGFLFGGRCWAQAPESSRCRCRCRRKLVADVPV